MDIMSTSWKILIILYAAVKRVCFINLCFRWKQVIMAAGQDLGGIEMVRKARAKDMDIIADMAALLWGNHSAADLKNEFSEILSKGKAQFFLKWEEDVPAGFAQCQLRYDYVEGTGTTPVGYLEGIFVKEACRNKGYARELLSECEAWAEENGCREFASDCEIDNTDSLKFHKAMNFTEANRIICFTKKL